MKADKTGRYAADVYNLRAFTTSALAEKDFKGYFDEYRKVFNVQ